MRHHPTPRLAAAILALTLAAAPHAAAANGPDVPTRPTKYAADTADALLPTARATLEDYLEQMNAGRTQDLWVYIAKQDAGTNQQDVVSEVVTQWGLDADDLLLSIDKTTNQAVLHVGPDSQLFIGQARADEIAEAASQRLLGGSADLAARTAALMVNEELQQAAPPSGGPGVHGAAPGAVITEEGEGMSGEFPEDGDSAPLASSEASTPSGASDASGIPALPQGGESTAPAQGADGATSTDAAADGEAAEARREQAVATERANSVVPIVMILGVLVVTGVAVGSVLWKRRTSA